MFERVIGYAQSTIQVDASGNGLGATLIQDDGPVALASKASNFTQVMFARNDFFKVRQITMKLNQSLGIFLEL